MCVGSSVLTVQILLPHALMISILFLLMSVFVLELQKHEMTLVFNINGCMVILHKVNCKLLFKRIRVI